MKYEKITEVPNEKTVANIDPGEKNFHFVFLAGAKKYIDDMPKKVIVAIISQPVRLTDKYIICVKFYYSGPHTDDFIYT
jgi:hypothetical protein